MCSAADGAYTEIASMRRRNSKRQQYSLCLTLTVTQMYSIEMICFILTMR
jgi:hypothetical protein